MHTLSWDDPSAPTRHLMTLHHIIFSNTLPKQVNFILYELVEAQRGSGPSPRFVQFVYCRVTDQTDISEFKSRFLFCTISSCFPSASLGEEEVIHLEWNKDISYQYISCFGMNCTDDLRFALKACFPAMIPHDVIHRYYNVGKWASMGFSIGKPTSPSFSFSVCLPVWAPSILLTGSRATLSPALQSITDTKADTSSPSWALTICSAHHLRMQ